MSFGFGTRPDHTPILFWPGVLASMWGAQVRSLATDLGTELDEVRERHEKWVTPEPIDCAMMRVDPGHVAGVTWGVVQYHFGDLDGILTAVVGQGFGELLDALAGRSPEAALLDGQARVAFVVQAVWQAFSSATSRAALEILISTRGVRGSAVNTHLAELMAKLTDLGRQLGIVVAQMTWPEPVDQSLICRHGSTS